MPPCVFFSVLMCLYTFATPLPARNQVFNCVLLSYCCEWHAVSFRLSVTIFLLVKQSLYGNGIFCFSSQYSFINNTNVMKHEIGIFCPFSYTLFISFFLSCNQLLSSFIFLCHTALFCLFPLSCILHCSTFLFSHPFTRHSNKTLCPACQKVDVQGTRLSWLSHAVCGVTRSGDMPSRSPLSFLLGKTVN